MTPHCSTFPLDLPLQCIQAAGTVGSGIVLDPFMGSGTNREGRRDVEPRLLGIRARSEDVRNRAGVHR